jgi:phospho-N-acetylmuramoyl-pentapeptide-transferase
MSTINITVNTATLVRILTLGFLTFFLSMAITPLYTNLAFKWKLWKKPREKTVTGAPTTIISQLHAGKHKRLIPTMAGIVFVVSVGLVTMAFNLDRSETWLPLAAFVGAGFVGLIDDIINVRGTGAGVAGLPSKLKFLMTTSIAIVGGLFFHYKLDVASLHVPLMTNSFHLGWLIIPLFVLVVVATANAVNITDGMDGLAGGLCAIAFAIYTIIAFLEGRYGVAGFCMAMVGGLMSYTWFNLFPARFFMGDVGSFALGTALGVVAMLTNTVFLLPIIGLVFVAETGSVMLQVTSKKLRHGKKLFKVSPVHYLFLANGWPETKVTERFWIIGQVAGVMGLILFVLGRWI